MLRGRCVQKHTEGQGYGAGYGGVKPGRDRRATPRAGRAWGGRGPLGGGRRSDRHSSHRTCSPRRDRGVAGPPAASALNNGGVAVKREAAKALDANTKEALETVLTTTRYTAQQEDDRVAVFTILGPASPEVKKYAERALEDGSPEAIRLFPSCGQYIARARDEETATIEQLVEIVEQEGKRAPRTTDKAVAFSERAKEPAEKAKAAALKAAEEAKAAQNDVRKSANAANSPAPVPASRHPYCTGPAA
ncbi:ALF repeat-containing protein [Streptomyces sp. NBC_01433]|uniref:ALF repeat-containing protein n=1 Tax=Streptomyces sp. NBC_01433 TaxID=2903864 RepID=UPI0022585C13|nr:ALF repeat-containing protein [Streptomyces sp. NBC_01433]MCX4677311.1 ALF repeat-containing protein [Streptomyces sp. NBC_01433]